MIGCECCRIQLENQIFSNDYGASFKAEKNTSEWIRILVKNKKLYFRGIFSLTQQFYDNITSCVISQKPCRLFTVGCLGENKLLTDLKTY